MRLIEAAEPTFARHETFHPRYGWFRKAYHFATENPQIFNRDDATVQLGVGKNMVRAIRFWGLAAKLIKIDPKPSKHRAVGLLPTRMGKMLFGETGWDQYMEDPGTLWLLHWLLLAPRSRLPIWWLAFNEFHGVEFTDQDLEGSISVQLEAFPDWASPHRSSIKKDIGALLRTYAPVATSGRTAIDDVLDCPLRELGLIRHSSATSAYRFTLGKKATLPAAILAFAALDYIARTNTRGNTATLNRLAAEPGAPGKVFKLTESEILANLETITSGSAGLGLVAATGTVQLTWSGEPRDIANDILEDYYRSPVAQPRARGIEGLLNSPGIDRGQ